MSKWRVRSLVLAGSIVCLLGIAPLRRATHRESVAVYGSPADRIFVHKTAHTMTLVRGGAILKTYRVALGRGGTGPKIEAGDDKVPEGVYLIVGRNARSTFHRALRVGYPTPMQVRQARERGVSPGGDIMIHGIRNGWGWIGALHRRLDWTKGCIAVTDEEMEEVWNLVPNGTPIEIDP